MTYQSNPVKTAQNLAVFFHNLYVQANVDKIDLLAEHAKTNEKKEQELEKDP